MECRVHRDAALAERIEPCRLIVGGGLSECDQPMLPGDLSGQLAAVVREACLEWHDGEPHRLPRGLLPADRAVPPEAIAPDEPAGAGVEVVVAPEAVALARRHGRASVHAASDLIGIDVERLPLASLDVRVDRSSVAIA